MGAKVQCGNYFQGYYSMKDLNEDARSGNWSQCHDDKMLKRGPYYNNGCTLRPMDGYSEYDREILKQTMLKHEAVFKKQVYELHRLYRIQKDLMDDLRRKKLIKYSFPVEMPQSSSFSFQMASGGMQNNWQGPGLQVVSSSVYTKPSVSAADTIQSSSTFPKEGILQVGSIPSRNGVKDCEFLNSRVKKFSQKMFDLQLPADEYIDCEESELIEDEKIPEIEVKLTLGTGSVCGSEGDSGKTNSHSQNILFVPKLVDLNEPNQGICIKEATTSSLVNFPNSVPSHEEVGWAQLSWKPNVSFQGPPKEFFLDNQMDGNHSSLNFLHEVREESRREWLSFNHEAGKSKSNGNSFTRAFDHDRGPTSSETIQYGFKQTHDLPSFLLSDQRQTGIWFRENSTCGAEISRKIPGPTKSNYVGPPFPPFPGSFPIFSQSDDTNTGTSFITSWRNSSLNQSSLVVQALPCYEEPAGIKMTSNTSCSSTQNPEASGDKWYLNSNLRSNPNLKGEVLHQNGFIHGNKSESNPSYVRVSPIRLDNIHINNSHNSGHEQSEDLGPRKFLKALDCEDVKSAKNMSLSLTLSNGFGDKGSMKRDLVQDGEGLLEHLSELRKTRVDECLNSKCETPMGLHFSQDYPPMIPSRDAEIQIFKDEFKRETAPGFVQNFSQPKAAETQNGGLSDGTNDKKNLDKPHISKEQCDFNPASNSIQDNFKMDDSEKNLKIGLLNGDCSCDLKLPDLARQLSVDLNTETAKSLTEQHRTQLSEISSKNEADLRLVTSVPTAVGKDNPPETSSKNTHLPENIPLGRESQNPHDDTVISTAAKTIVAMSSDNCDQSNMADFRDCLDWFAEVVVSHGGDLECGEGVFNGDFKCSDDGLDFFEVMTLRLTETKTDEYLCKSRTREEEEKGGGSALQSQSSKGRLRWGRQRRDFQREILPGIASLSRHEVTEDLQTIGGLMRASGCSWPPGLARRGGGRNDWHFPARGRRRARCGPNAGTGNLVQEACNGEADPDGRSLKGIPWGKTTRRRRMQRFPAGTSCTPLI